MGEAGLERVEAVCAALLKEEAPPVARELDARLQRVLDWVDRNLAGNIRQSDAVAVADASESWFPIGLGRTSVFHFGAMSCGVDFGSQYSTLWPATP